MASTWRDWGRRFGGALFVGALATALAACGTATEPDEATPAPTSSPVSGSYSCSGYEIPFDVLSNPRTAAELSDDTRASLSGVEVPAIDPAEWLIASADAQAVVLFRELADPYDHGAGDVRTHEVMAITIVDAVNIPNSPNWALTLHGTCALGVDVPGAGSAVVTLDPAAPPEPSSTEIALLVTEMSCNDGRNAEGRVEVVMLRETEETVEVIMAVTPLGGNHTCPSNPATPFALTLEEPLGERQLLDASVVPPMTIVMPTALLIP